MNTSSSSFRNLVLQLALLLAIGMVGGYALHNLAHNLSSRGITVGFGYWTQEAGFDISEKLIAHEATSSYGRAFLVGVLNTLFVSACGVVAASVLGLLIGIGRLSSHWLVQRLCSLYVEAVRNVPLILQLLLWYGMLTQLLPPVADALQLGPAFVSQRGIVFPWPVPHPGWPRALAGLVLAVVAVALLLRWAGRSQARTGHRPPILPWVLTLLLGLPLAGWTLGGAPTDVSHPVLGAFDFEGGKTVSPEFLALAFGLSVYTAAFIAEIVRGGIQSVPRGQVDASLALGLAPAQRLRLVVLPQALRVIIPPLTSQYLNLTKNSSLAVAVGYPDLVNISNTTLNQTGQAIEAIVLMMAVYLAISLSISGLMNWYNSRARLVER